jgi:DNA-binding transcriptional LysR family regulator
MSDIPIVRVGYHGSRPAASRVVGDAGRVELVGCPVDDPFTALRAGGVDVLLVKFDLDQPDLERGRTLATEGRAVIVAEGHPLAGRDAVSVEELADYGAFHRPGTFPGYLWDQIVPPFTPAGRPIRRLHRAATIPEMMARVAGSDAVHLSLVSLGDVAPPGIRIIPVSDLPPVPVYLVWRRDLAPGHVRDFVSGVEARG